MKYLYPVDYSGVSTLYDHLKVRSTPSVEPGVDLYCPTGTELHAPWNGVVAEVGGGIVPATGRYLTLNLDPDETGARRRIRFLHLQSRNVRVGDRVTRGQVIGHTGASGYGSEFFGEPYRNEKFWAETGGDHVHVTLWPTLTEAYNNGRSRNFTGVLDFQDHADHTPASIPAGGNATSPEEDDMAKPYVQVKDDRGNFAMVGPDGVGKILSGAALRGAGKVARAANGGDLPEVELSGEEWDAASLNAFRGLKI